VYNIRPYTKGVFLCHVAIAMQSRMPNSDTRTARTCVCVCGGGGVGGG